MRINEEDHDALMHYGTKRRSGRYPWGSGEHPDPASFAGAVRDLKKKGLTEKQVAEAFGLNTRELRAAVAIAGNAKKQADIAQAQAMKEKGMSNMAIGRAMDINESSVRALLAPGAKDKADVLASTSEMLRERLEGLENGGFVDVGKGVANQLGMSKTKLDTAVAMLEAEGYTTHRVPIPQLGTQHETTTKVLCPPGTEWKDVMQNRDKIVGVQDWTEDGGRTWMGPKDPIPFDSSRVDVVWGPDGGSKADGVLYVRPGAEGLDMGGARYAQARVLIDGTHYLKGMAVLKDDLPDGVDIQFHTNKDPRKISEEKGRPATKMDAMKKAEVDANGNVLKDNPFGASIRRQIQDEHGNVKSAINIVNEDATWDDWSRNLASQMLSKQTPELVKAQLDITYAKKKDQLDEIMALTNPTVRERLLRSYADDMDSSAVHLKAAHMPRQKTHVILPINSLKDTEIYAPGYNDGETVVLIRYPHGGKFEIPTLTVNNRNAQGKKFIGPDSTSAVGINHKVAQRLSGADFDGDTVVVIPNNRGRIKTESPLPGLQGFDPQAAYPKYPGMKVMSNTQTEMGKISNLITDMTIAGASPDELARAVRHSMVVIDAEKHELNYKLSAERNGISALRKKYQPGKHAGAATIISRTTGDRDVPDFKPRPASEGGPIDRKTGRLVFVPTNRTSSKRVVDKTTGEVKWVQEPKTKSVPRGGYEELPDGTVIQRRTAFDLVSKNATPVERLYASYSDKVRDLANKARLEVVNNTQPVPYSPSASKVYHKEVASLNTKLNEALKHAPLERQAQVIANAEVKLKKAANPLLSSDKDLLKKTQAQALKTARARVSPDGKQKVTITTKEWEAIQAGAITKTKLKEILDRADIDEVKQLATPRTTYAMNATKRSRARALASAGYTQAEIAQELGVSVSTLQRGLKEAPGS